MAALSSPEIGHPVELHDYLKILRRRWALIVATTLVVLIGAAFVTYRATPQYTSTARVFVSTSPSDTDSAYQGGLFSQQRVSSYADLVSGLELTKRVVDSLDLNMTAEELSERVTAKVVPDTVLLSISVTNPDPAQAQRITNAMVTELADFVKELETPAGAKRALIKATLIDPARLPETPSSPDPNRNLGLGLVLGLLLGFGLAVLRELLDTTVKSAQVAEEISGSPVLGGIGEDPEAIKEPVISALSPHAPRAEAFRVLRTNVQFLEVDSASKAFVVTSSMPADGKSSTAINLAVAIAQAGQRVLLLDADLRRPQVAGRLGLEAGVGLTTVLLGKVELDDALQEHTESGLTVLTSGAIPPNPAELLQSHAMRDLIAQVRERFDVVILDSPPLLPVTDASLLASLTDGAILVLRHGQTTREQLAGAVERLRGVGSMPLGVVLNRIPRKRTGYGYGYGYGYAPDSESSRSRRAGGASRARSDGEQERARKERKEAKLRERDERRQAKAVQRKERAALKAETKEARASTRRELAEARALKAASRRDEKQAALADRERLRRERAEERRQSTRAHKEKKGRRAAEDSSQQESPAPGEPPAESSSFADFQPEPHQEYTFTLDTFGEPFASSPQAQQYSEDDEPEAPPTAETQVVTAPLTEEPESSSLWTRTFGRAEKLETTESGPPDDSSDDAQPTPSFVWPPPRDSAPGAPDDTVEIQDDGPADDRRPRRNTRPTSPRKAGRAIKLKRVQRRNTRG